MEGAKCTLPFIYMSSKNKKTVAFVYKWIELSTQKWYIGSRTANGCHPDDGYICSSKTVKPMIQSNPQDWVRVILETGSPAEMRELESELLITLDAKNAPMSYNMHNGDGKFSYTGATHSPEARAKIGASSRGRKLEPLSPETRAKISAAKKGKAVSPDHREKLSAASKGKPKSPEHRAAIIKVIIATNLSNGEVFEIRGGQQELWELGFHNTAVSMCTNGKRPHHKGHTFRFKDTQED